MLLQHLQRKYTASPRELAVYKRRLLELLILLIQHLHLNRFSNITLKHHSFTARDYSLITLSKMRFSSALAISAITFLGASAAPNSPPSYGTESASTSSGVATPGGSTGGNIPGNPGTPGTGTTPVGGNNNNNPPPSGGEGGNSNNGVGVRI
jgi:hypothetical protein